jgi:cathepsin L
MKGIVFLLLLMGIAQAQIRPNLDLSNIQTNIRGVVIPPNPTKSAIGALPPAGIASTTNSAIGPLPPAGIANTTNSA